MLWRRIRKTALGQNYPCSGAATSGRMQGETHHGAPKGDGFLSKSGDWKKPVGCSVEMPFGRARVREMPN